MDESDVEAYVERSASLIESSPQMDEQNTKGKLIRPLIELLGWDVYSSEVKWEYSMQIGSGSTRADYALLLEGAPVVFIEAKGCDTTLTDSDRSQLKSYMRQTGVDWGLLTNGVEFEILKRRTNSTRPDEVTLGTPSLEELVDEYELLELLSKELVESGEADRIAERMEATKRAVRTLRTDKERIAERVTQIITDEVEDLPAQEIQPVSKEYIDDLIDSLATNGEIGTKPERESQEETEELSENSQYVVTLHDDETALQSFSEEKQSTVMAAVIDSLVRKHRLVDEIGSLPYVPGQKYAILNTKPRHQSGEEMKSYKELSSGCYLFTSLNRKSKQRYIRQFTEMCGLTAEFSGGW